MNAVLLDFGERTAAAGMATMSSEARTQSSRVYSATSDASAGEDIPVRPVIAWSAGLTLPRRPDFPRLLERAVVVALLAGWLAVTWGRVKLFLSEPTATRIYWERSFQRPAFSVCPHTAMNVSVLSLFDDSAEKAREALIGNLSLQEFIRTSSLQVVDMVEGLNETDEYRADAGTQVFTEYYGTWKTSWNYVEGGACATLTPKSYTLDVEHLRLRRQPQFESSWKGSAVYSYNVIIHGNSEYWGLPVADMETYIVTNETTREEVYITIDREVKPNLRRAPCESDPAYNIATCQRRCYFAWISCRMEEDAADDGRPLCMASQAHKFLLPLGGSQFSKFLYDIENIRWPVRECPCLKPCAADRFGFHLRPSLWPSSAESLQLQLRLGDVRRVMEMFVTYTAWDLLADMGGYLGLLLGSSLLSVFGTAHQLVGRIYKQCAAFARRTTMSSTRLTQPEVAELTGIH